ncbi:MAG: hypothetical protein KBD73_00390 [Candidatus Magasanikbacteria bacterium]|nr:hypothetical protein [Candidatus Magasanikbacteria bacterium]
MSLSDAIISTIAYFDVFGYPLTAIEILAYLWSNETKSLELINNELARLLAAKKIETKSGFFFLPNRENIVLTRQNSVQHVAQKLNRAKRAAKLIRYVPFVEAMFVCNTVAAGSAQKSSDIDVFIIITPDRLWLSRLLITGLLHIFSLRRHGKKIDNRICLSFYIASDHLNLKSIALENDDIYLHYWIRQLLPIYDPKNFWQKMQSANGWIDKKTPRPSSAFKLIDRYRTEDCKRSRMIKKILEKFWQGGYGDLIESQAKGIQETHMKKRHASEISKQHVIVNDHMMKFHENDRREYFRDEWRKRYSNVISTKHEEKSSMAE